MTRPQSSAWQWTLLSLSLGMAFSTAFPSIALAQKEGKAAASKSKVLTITLGSKGNEMAFDKTKLNAKPGQKIKLTMINRANKNSGMYHNFVLVKPGKADEVGLASLAAGLEKGWLADSDEMKKQIIKHTKMLDPGQKDTIEFEAPKEPGEYPYICTYPGHYTVMRGVLIVK